MSVCCLYYKTGQHHAHPPSFAPEGRVLLFNVLFSLCTCAVTQVFFSTGCNVLFCEADNLVRAHIILLSIH